MKINKLNYQYGSLLIMIINHLKKKFLGDQSFSCRLSDLHTTNQMVDQRPQKFTIRTKKLKRENLV